MQIQGPDKDLPSRPCVIARIFCARPRPGGREPVAFCCKHVIATTPTLWCASECALPKYFTCQRLREVARAVLPALAVPGWDYVLVARPGATVERDFAALLEDMRAAMRSVHRAAK